MKENTPSGSSFIPPLASSNQAAICRNPENGGIVLIMEGDLSLMLAAKEMLDAANASLKKTGEIIPPSLKKAIIDGVKKTEERNRNGGTVDCPQNVLTQEYPLLKWENFGGSKLNPNIAAAPQSSKSLPTNTPEAAPVPLSPPPPAASMSSVVPNPTPPMIDQKPNVPVPAVGPSPYLEPAPVFVSFTVGQKPGQICLTPHNSVAIQTDPKNPDNYKAERGKLTDISDQNELRRAGFRTTEQAASMGYLSRLFGEATNSGIDTYCSVDAPKIIYENIKPLSANAPAPGP